MFDLNKYWNPKLERCGVVLLSNLALEIENQHPIPSGNFSMAATELASFKDTISHLWHTHPSNNVNLSIDDYHAFLAYPQYRHLIVGRDRVAEYYVISGVVYRTEFLGEANACSLR